MQERMEGGQREREGVCEVRERDCVRKRGSKLYDREKWRASARNNGT